MTKLLKYFFIAAHLLVITGVNAQTNTKQYQSLLWEIIHPDNPNSKSYLYGTMHVSSRLAFNLSDTFFAGLAGSSIIALETEPTMWLEELADYKWATSYFGPYPSNTFASKGFYQRIFPLNPPQNAVIGSYLSSSEEILNALQYRNSDYARDFEEDTYLDMFIFQAGMKMGKKVLGLENIAHTNELLRIAQSERRSKKDDKPIPLWLEERMKKEDLSDIFENAYRVQDLDLLMEIQEIFSTAHYLNWFLYERNRLMADSMFVLMRNHSVFAGVGAAHLAGDKGMITFLRQMGCKVRPVNAMRTEYAQNEKKRIESIEIPLSLSLQISPDKQFEIALPAKLYELPDFGKRFICSEMTHGSYFFISKISTYDFFGNIGEEGYLAKIDSLLFENIPGTILSKQQIKKGGFQGLEIKNKTKTGDLQHYQIYVTPLEILIFKMGGKGEFISKWSDSVFASLRFLHAQQDKKWTSQSHYYGGFAAQFPAYTVCDNNSKIAAIYNQPLFQGFDFSQKAYFVLTRNYLADMNYVEEDLFEFTRTAQKLAKKHQRELEGFKTFIKDGLPMAEFVLKAPKGSKANTVFCRMIIDGPAYYLLLATTKQQKTAQQLFFNKFTLTPSANANLEEVFNDTFMFFRTQTNVGVNQSELRMRSKAETPKPHESMREYYVFKSPSGERMRVGFEKFHQYQSYKNADSLFAALKKGALENEEISYEIVEEKRFEKNKAQQMELLLSDTGSSRAIRILFYLKKEQDACYTFRMPVSRTKTHAPFWDLFISSFTPYDTLLGSAVLQTKGELFVADILSGDSMRFLKAMNGVGFVSFNTEEVPAILNQIVGYPFEAKNQLYLLEIVLEKLSETQHVELIAFAKQTYLQYANNYPIQIASLKVLSAQRSKAAMHALEEIIKSDLPYIMTQDRSVLSPLRIDSMALWTQLYPLLFAYSHIPDYKQMVYDDLTRFSDSQLILATFYTAFLPQLIEESEYAIKAYIAAEQKKQLEQAKNKAKSEKKSNHYGTYNQALFQKYKLLLPYAEQPEVAEVLKKYETLIENDWDKVMMIKQKLKVGLSVDTALIHQLASQKHVLFHLYKQLSEIGKTDLIPQKYKKDEHRVPLLLNVSTTNYYNYNPSLNDIDLENDTIQLLQTVKKKTNEGDFMVFVYEIKQIISAVQAEKRNFDPKDYHRLAIVAVQMKGDELDIFGKKYSKKVKVENLERKDKYIEELIESFEINKRPRASATEEDSFFSFW